MAKPKSSWLSGNPGDFRVIHHLSFPENASINDGIPNHLCTVQYQTVDAPTLHSAAMYSGTGNLVLIASPLSEIAYQMADNATKSLLLTV
jgi:hypothetical protein